MIAELLGVVMMSVLRIAGRFRKLVFLHFDPSVHRLRTAGNQPPSIKDMDGGDCGGDDDDDDGDDGDDSEVKPIALLAQPYEQSNDCAQFKSVGLFLKP